MPVHGFRLFLCPSNMPSNIGPVDARGATASFLQQAMDGQNKPVVWTKWVMKWICFSKEIL